MRSLGTASERDLRTLAGIVTDDRTDLPVEGLPWSLLSELAEQIRCDQLSFFGMDSDRQQVWFMQEVPAGNDSAAEEAELEKVYWEQHWACECSYPERSGDLRSITKIADFYSSRQWHSIGMYTEYYRPAGLEHDLMLCLPAERGPTLEPLRSVRLLFGRGPGPDFSERDRALLALLRPHLHQAYLDAERRRHPTPQLTPRQGELLSLVAAGHTNTQIARRLGLSEATVRTHLENIYGKLDVSSRTAAVARAFPDRAAC